MSQTQIPTISHQISNTLLKNLFLCNKFGPQYNTEEHLLNELLHQHRHASQLCWSVPRAAAERGFGRPRASGRSGDLLGACRRRLVRLNQVGERLCQVGPMTQRVGDTAGYLTSMELFQQLCTE